jgi:hypothetical protein
MEMVVVKSIAGAARSREVWEEERGEDEPPMSDLQIFIENTTEVVRRHGVVIAQLAMVPGTRAELQASMPDAVKRIPAWLEARVCGPPLMTPELFVRGIAQLMAEHRVAIERVVAEQVLEPEPIEESLALAPLPAGGADEPNGETIAAVGQAMGAHLDALMAIARDLDQRLAAIR